jgi:hypothetical protein
MMLPPSGVWTIQLSPKTGFGLGDSQSAQVIAKKIIQIGQSGVHDPAQISELAIKQLASISASVPALSNSRPARGWVDQVDQL